jgi:hypothetical protein
MFAVSGTKQHENHLEQKIDNYIVILFCHYDNISSIFDSNNHYQIAKMEPYSALKTEQGNQLLHHSDY